MARTCVYKREGHVESTRRLVFTCQLSACEYTGAYREEEPGVWEVEGILFCHQVWGTETTLLRTGDCECPHTIYHIHVHVRLYYSVLVHH